MDNLFSSAVFNEVRLGDKFDTSNVITMNYMFYESQIEKIDLSKINTSNITEMSSMFKGCKCVDKYDLRF